MNEKVLVACEESQTVCVALRNIGIEAYSCDIVPCSGGHPEWHIQDDVLKHLNDGWDGIIAHPPCTYLCSSGLRWLYNKDGSQNQNRFRLQEEAINFFMAMYNAPVDFVAVENPIGIMSSRFRRPDQIIHPYMFGEPLAKSTCLWLRGFKPLKPTNVVPIETVTSGSGRVWSKWFWDTSLIPYKDRGKIRSKTFKCFAEAIAKQWFPLSRGVKNED